MSALKNDRENKVSCDRWIDFSDNFPSLCFFHSQFVPSIYQGPPQQPFPREGGSREVTRSAAASLYTRPRSDKACTTRVIPLQTTELFQAGDSLG
mmetsp:Transcript_29062/g.56940  ORF Transcript_29062/g.56940 Transcript_29062/m.56940 type:complete len:95 (+) Transcript_29062:168-452(+)